MHPNFTVLATHHILQMCILETFFQNHKLRKWLYTVKQRDFIPWVAQTDLLHALAFNNTYTVMTTVGQSVLKENTQAFD